jgi:predicted transcriptional regulator
MLAVEAPAWEPSPRVVQTGVVAAVAGLVVLVWPVVRAAGPVFLFSRTRTSRLLEHPTRAQIHALADSEPGVHGNEIVRRLGEPRSVVDHHLRKLVDAGLLVRRQGLGIVCYFVPGRVDRRAMAAVPLLRAPGARAVMQVVQAEPGLSGADVARRVDFDSSTVAYHVRRLRRAGAIRGRRQGRRVELYPTDPAAAALTLAAADASIRT